MKKTIFIAMSAGLLSTVSQAMTLDEYIQTVESKHRTLKALSLQSEASQDKKNAGDVGLSSVLTASVAKVDDKNPLNTYGASRSQVTQYTLGLGKKLSSGTSLGVSLVGIDAQNDGIANPTSAAVLSKFGTGSVGLSVSQSLLKDGFGEATSLRHTREDAVMKLEKSSYDLQYRQVMIESEQAFWDFAFSDLDLQIRKENLERAQKIFSWVQKRVSDGIGDRADFLNAQSLVALREFQLITSQDERLAAEKKIRDTLELAANEATPSIKENMDQARGLRRFLNQKGRVLRLDSYLAVLESELKSTVVEETAEGLKSDLTLAGSYKTNVYKSQFSDALSNVTDTAKPTSQVSLTWTYLFDNEDKNSVLSASRGEARAAQIKKERKLLESESSWSELQRRYEEMNKKLVSLEKLSRIQTERAQVERQKLSQGRSITSQVITAEQDAAESVLNLMKLKSELRKLESQARMFVAVEGAL